MRKVRSYVSRKKRLTNLQQRALEAYREHYCFTFNPQGNRELESYLRSAPAVLEIGFGMGEVTAEIAEAHRDINYLGIEVFEPGIGKLLHEIAHRDLQNLKILAHDAVEVIDCMIPEHSLEGVHIFFPDPWPKKRHHKRRLIQEPFVEKLIPLLKPGGYLYSVTDWEDYAHQILGVFSSFDELVNPFESFAEPLPWRPTSKFEQKGVHKNHAIWEIFVRKGQ